MPAGVAQVIAGVTFAANYAVATSTVTIDVAKATPAITWATPAAITYGTALSGTQLNAITQPLVAGTFTYTVGGTAAGGQILAAGPHTITATFTPADTANYSAATATVTITVTQ